MKLKCTTPEAIKEETIRLIREHGYQNVTVMDICNACGITRPTFYKYAGSKEELILDFYDSTVDHILHDPTTYAIADSHYEQLCIIFAQLLNETRAFGADLFSQMLIANLNEDRKSFDMRNSLTDLCILLVKKAQEHHEILSPADPALLYKTAAYCFMGYETTWCIRDGKFSWAEDFFLSLNALLNVAPPYTEIYKKLL